MKLTHFPIIVATALSVAAGSTLVSATGTGPAMAGEIVVATSKNQAMTDRRTLVIQARKANQTRSGNDDEWDECMKNGEGEFTDILIGCFCLTTPEAACGEDHSWPVN